MKKRIKELYLYDIHGELHIVSKPKNDEWNYLVATRKSLSAIRNAAYKWNDEVMFYVYDKETVKFAMAYDHNDNISDYCVEE